MTTVNSCLFLLLLKLCYTYCLDVFTINNISKYYRHKAFVYGFYENCVGLENITKTHEYMASTFAKCICLVKTSPDAYT